MQMWVMLICTRIKVPADKAKGETGAMRWVIQATGSLCLAELRDSARSGSRASANQFFDVWSSFELDLATSSSHRQAIALNSLSLPSPFHQLTVSFKTDKQYSTETLGRLQAVLSLLLLIPLKIKHTITRHSDTSDSLLCAWSKWQWTGVFLSESQADT